jgi:uncharacterized peroxidase-related enzyme
MSRIHTPASIDAAPADSRALLEAVNKKFGTVPNLFRLVSNSPAALQGYLGMSGALDKGALPAATRERIALAIAEQNGCGYCLSAHTYIGKHLAKLDDGEIAANRRGDSHDAKAAAAVRFAVSVLRKRGHLDDAELSAVRAAGYDDAQLVEIVQHVALNVWTNFLNNVGGTAIDFPVVQLARAA